MSESSFGDRLRKWGRRSKQAPAIAPMPPVYEQIANHANPLGMLDWAKRPHAHSMPIGVDRHHQMIYTKPETSIGWIGPARAMGGKSASGTVPSLMEHNGSAAVMSLRTDALNATAAMRSLRGRVSMFDPDGLGVPEGVEEKRWSLLCGAEDLDSALVTGRAFVKSANVIMSSARTASENMHFSEQAGTMLGVADHFSAMVGRSFRFVESLTRAGKLQGYYDILELLSHWGDQRPHDALSGVINMPGDREFGSIQTTLNVAMGAYSTEAALRTTDHPNLVPEDLARGSLHEDNPWLWTADPSTPGKGTGDTLYLIRGDKKVAAAINVAIITQVIEARLALYRADEKAGNADAHPDVLFCLDEMANMPLPQLPELLAAPGRGCLFTGMLQDFSQLSKWGEEGTSMLTQLQQLVVYRGQRVADTLRLIESLCPTTATERVMPSGKGEGSMLAASASPERLPGIPTHRIYSGINTDPTTVLYLGADGAPPDWIHIRPYYSDPMLLHTQVKSLWQMAQGLHRDDPRRLLPLPNLDRDGTGRALLAAGGEPLRGMYRDAVKGFGKPGDTQEVRF